MKNVHCIKYQVLNHGKIFTLRCGQTVLITGSRLPKLFCINISVQFLDTPCISLLAGFTSSRQYMPTGHKTYRKLLNLVSSSRNDIEHQHRFDKVGCRSTKLSAKSIAFIIVVFPKNLLYGPDQPGNQVFTYWAAIQSELSYYVSVTFWGI